jgi:crossover junction endonuclease MUS81
MWWLDNRERELVTQLDASAEQVKMLPVGDFWLGVDAGTRAPVAGGLVIERKSVRDLEASILDGRYREQRQRLLAFCQANGAQPLYVLEGPFRSTTGRLGVPALMKLVARLQYKHAVPVLQTESVEETATLLKSLVDYYKEDATNFQRSTTPLRSVEGIHVSKKVNAEDPKQFYVAALCQCPGVSVKIAEAIQAVFPTLTELMAADEKGVAGIVQGSGRKVGPAVARRLITLLHG